MLTALHCNTDRGSRVKSVDQCANEIYLADQYTSTTCVCRTPTLSCCHRTHLLGIADYAPSNQPRITCVIELVFVRCKRDSDRIKRSKLLFVITPWHGWAVPPVPNIGNIYRVAHLVENLGWVDLNFDFHCLPN